MAKLKDNNILFRGVSGKLGSFVLRNTKHGTIIANKPGKRKPNSATPAQVEVQGRFTDASNYAKRVMMNSETRSLYEVRARKEATSVYQVAMSDYLKAPSIHSVQLYKRINASGHEIRILADDDFRVASVSVQIRNPHGVVIEQGEASPAYKGYYSEWSFLATSLVASWDTCTVDACVQDLPGNRTVVTATCEL